MLSGLLQGSDLVAVWQKAWQHPMLIATSSLSAGARKVWRGGQSPSCAVSLSWGHPAVGCCPCRIRLPILPHHGSCYRCVARLHLPEGDENAMTAESLPLQQTQLPPSSPLFIFIPTTYIGTPPPAQDPSAPSTSPLPGAPSQVPPSLAPGPQGDPPRVLQCTASPRHSLSKAPAAAKKATYQGPVESTSPTVLPIRCPSPPFPATTSSPRGCSAHPALCRRMPAGERSGEAGTRGDRAVR